VHGGYRYRSPFRGLSDRDYIAACVDDLRGVIETMTAGDVACLIAEPIQGVGGFTSPPDGYLAALKEVLDEYGILLVADEVQTGWGRTGEHFWGIEAHGVTPDLMTFAKGIGNGLSIGGVVGRADIVDALPANSISTFGGNPLSCAGALANLRYLLDSDLQGNALARGGELRAALEDIAAEHSVVGDVRGKGLMLAVELVEPGTGDPGRPSQRAAALAMEETKAAGLLVGKGGLYGNVLRVAPPLSVTAEEIEEGAQILRKAIAAVGARMAESA
jgi:4-aminobutyrate aminotransferase